MSRTYKDCPYKLRYPHQRRDDYIVYREEPWLQYKVATGFCRETYQTIWEQLPFPVWHIRTWKIPGPTTAPKVQRFVLNRDYNWAKRAPSWWTRMFMNKPQRHRGRQWERRVLFEDLEDTDPPGVGHKPYTYYW